MANEVLHSGLGDLSLSEVAAQEFALLMADRSILGNHGALIYAGDLKGSKSATVQFSAVGIQGYDLLGDAGENASVANTAFSDSSASVSVARKAVKYNVSELAAVTGSDLGCFFDPEKVALSALVARETKLRDMICNVIDGFASGVGTTGVALTLDDIQSALETLQSNAVPSPYLAILHPSQWADIKASVRGELTLSPMAQEMVAKAPELGYQGNWMGVDFFVTTSVVASGGDKVGAIFGRGCVVWADASFPANIPGVQKLNLGKAQVAYDESASTAMTDVVISCYLGVSLGQDKGVKITSVA